MRYNWQIFTNETPLGELAFSQFIELVVEQNVRPERPDDEDAPQLSDALWELVEKCWVKDPKSRPTANAVCNTLSDLLHTAAITPLTPLSSPSHPVTFPQSLTQPDSRVQAPLSRPLLPLLNTSPIVKTTTGAQPISNPISLDPIRQLVGTSYFPAYDSLPRSLSSSPDLTLRRHTAWLFCAAFSSNNKYIASGSDSGTLIVWDAETGNVTLEACKHSARLSCVAFSPNSKQIASGSRDKIILVWDVLTGKVAAKPFEGHTNMVKTLCFSLDGRRIASGSHDNTVRVWDAQTGNIIFNLIGHTGGVGSIVFSPNGEQIASGSKDKTIIIWAAHSGRMIMRTQKKHEKFIRFVAFSPDGKKIISMSKGGDPCIWDAKTGALLSLFVQICPVGSLAVTFTPQNTYYCAISPDGKWIAHMEYGYSCIKSGCIYIRNTRTGKFASIVDSHSDRITSLAFSADSKRVLSASWDKIVQVYTLNF